MRSTIWNILAVLILAAILLVWVVVFQVFLNPQSSLNPLPPPTNVPTLALPTLTPTFRQLPPTWTPAVTEVVVIEPQLRASSTLLPSSTVYVANTFTATPTSTNTPTNTATATNTPTVTKTATVTNTPEPTHDLTATALSINATHIAETQAAE